MWWWSRRRFDPRFPPDFASCMMHGEVVFVGSNRCVLRSVPTLYPRLNLKRGQQHLGSRYMELRVVVVLVIFDSCARWPGWWVVVGGDGRHCSVVSDGRVMVLEGFTIWSRELRSDGPLHSQWRLYIGLWFSFVLCNVWILRGGCRVVEGRIFPPPVRFTAGRPDPPAVPQTSAPPPPPGLEWIGVGRFWAEDSECEHNENIVIVSFWHKGFKNFPPPPPPDRNLLGVARAWATEVRYKRNDNIFICSVLASRIHVFSPKCNLFYIFLFFWMNPRNFLYNPIYHFLGLITNRMKRSLFIIFFSAIIFVLFHFPHTVNVWNPPWTGMDGLGWVWGEASECEHNENIIIANPPPNAKIFKISSLLEWSYLNLQY